MTIEHIKKPINTLIALVYADIFLLEHQEKCKICQRSLKHQKELTDVTVKVIKEYLENKQ